MKNCQGFSLVETLVAMTLTVILASGLWTLYNLFEQRTIEDSGMSLLQMQYDNVGTQIGMSTHHASVVVDALDAWPIQGGLSQLSTSTVYMMDDTGNVFAGYRISPQKTLQEYIQSQKNSWVWSDYLAGKSVVKTDGGNAFVLAPNRRSLTIRMTLSTTIKQKTMTLDSRGDIILCRN
jgi:prepilin-type N-terminal cleavage/methylation domain-containing protein